MKYEIFNVDLVGHLAREWGSLSRENIETFSFLRRTAIDMELRSDVSLTFLGALIQMIGMFMIHLCGGRLGILDTYVLESDHPPHLPLAHQGTEAQSANRNS